MTAPEALMRVASEDEARELHDLAFPSDDWPPDEHPDYDHAAAMARDGLAVATAGDLDRMATKYPDRYGRLVTRMSDRED